MSSITEAQQTGTSSEQDQLDVLKKILLQEDRSEIADLRAILDNKEQLEGKVSPIIKEHLDFLKENFAKDYEAVIGDMVAKKLEASQDDLLNVLYPVIGKMIKKFIGNEFQKLKDSIDQQVKSTFSKQGLFGKLNFFSKSKKAANEVLAGMDKARVDEIFIIQKNSGLLIAHAGYKKDGDADIIAGMFTAIKAFVEDAFQKKTEELEMIEYGTYKIFVQSFHSYYMAAAISGSLSSIEREEMQLKMFDFAERELKKKIDMGLVNEDEQLSKLLSESFIEAKELV